MNILLSFILGMLVLSSPHSPYTAVNRGESFSLDPESIAQEYKPPSRGRSGNGVGGGTRFDGRTASSLIS